MNISYIGLRIDFGHRLLSRSLMSAKCHIYHHFMLDLFGFRYIEINCIGEIDVLLRAAICLTEFNLLGPIST